MTQNVFSDAPNVALGARIILDDLIFVAKQRKYWWVSKRMLVTQTALNVILTPVLQSMGVGLQPSRWLREQRNLRVAIDIGSFPGQPLMVGDMVNITWGSHEG